MAVLRAALGLALLPAVAADLPAHCLLQDIAGQWAFHLGPPSAALGASSSHGARLPACGHHIPNNVLSMLSLNSSTEVPPVSERVMLVNLTETIDGSPVRHLRAVADGTKEGLWTMVFDEGFEMRLFSGESFFAHSFFRVANDANATPKNGDRWTDIAEYHGRRLDQIRLDASGQLYECHCNMTSVGWWHRRTNGALESGCWWGHKIAGPPARTSFVRLRASNQTADEHLALLFGGKVLGGVAPGSRMGGRPSKVKEVFYRVGEDDPPPGPSAPSKSLATLASIRRLRALPTTTPPPSSLPQSWDWRQVMKDMWHDGRDGLSEQFDQGNCGSCYAFSGAMVLQMRFRIQLLRKHGVYYPLELSWKSATRCSPYTEGCDGGFAYLTFKLAAEIGLPLADCDRGYEPQALDNACDWSCYGNETMVFYAKNYGQVGGFSHGASEETIMKEIYENGPVIVSFATSAAPEFIYNNGESWTNRTTVMTGFLNHKVPEEASSSNPSIRPWRYTTHSILAVGWGEETTSDGQVVKYWIVRNSWGTDWGTNGYAKMRRGFNDAALETSAPWVAPDMERLPAGFLEMARQRHDAEIALRAQAKGAAGAGSDAAPAEEGHLKRGPTYCELRPDSPDCK